MAILIGTFADGAGASETDPFTGREKPLQDSSPYLNKKMEDVLGQIAAKSQDCDENVIYSNLVATLGGWAKARIESWVDEAPSSRSVDEDESVIKGTSISFCCETTVRIGNSYVSGDKLGHFLHSGFEVFHMVRSQTEKPILDSRSMIAKVFDWGAKPPVPGPTTDLAGDDLESSYTDTLGDQKLARISTSEMLSKGRTMAAKFSNGQEDGYWGLKMTGVKSYGDIAANDAGYLFWNELTTGKNPFFQCKKGKWARNSNRPFRFEEYVNDAWDEGVNCSEYLAKDKDRIKDQIAKATKGKGCPVSGEKCKSLQNVFGPYAGLIISPLCKSSVQEQEATGPESSTQGAQ